jgi:TonB-linked SusC/RagA family outer membrane protein
MRLIVFLFFISLIHVSASVYSQKTKLNVKLENASLTDVFKVLQEQSEFDFFYKNEQIPADAKVSIEFKNEKIEVILDVILTGTGLTYHVLDKDIVITSNQSIKGELSSQQQKSVSGKVTDSTGASLPGVSVVVKGTTTGVITDMDGKYSLSKIPQNATLQFSFVGMKTQEIIVESKTTINVTLVEEAIGIEEVVAMGYSTQKRKSITGATNSINAKDIDNLPVTNINQALQGRVAGVDMGTSGNPSSQAVVRIRGINSFNSGNSPLYVVDGIQFQGNINAINPSDVESVNVLMDGTSASIYGARAAGGVIVITTKKGKANQKPKLTFNSYMGFNIADNLPDMVNTEQFAQSIWLSRSAAGLATQHPQFGNGASPVIPDFISPVASFEGDPGTGISDYDLINNQIMRTGNTNWFDEITEPGLTQNYNLALTGSGNGSQYGVSFNYLNKKGSIIYTGFERYNIKLNSEFSLLNNKIKIGENIIVSKNASTGSSGENAVNLSFLMPPAVPVRDIAGNFAGTRGGALSLGTNFDNPVAVMYRNRDNFNGSIDILGNVYAGIEILKGLSAKTNLGFVYDVGKSSNFNFKNPEQLGGNATNSLNVGSSDNYNWTFTNTLEYSNLIAKDHNVGILLGTEAIEELATSFSASRKDFFAETKPYRYLIASSGSQTNGAGTPVELRLSSVFGKLDYAYKDKYFFSTTIRRDGSSRFGENNRYGTFESVGVAWQISDESFLKNSSIINSLKLKASSGNAGNQSAVGQYLSADLFAPDSQFGSYDINATNTQMVEGIIKTSRGNPDVKWESSSTLNFALEGVIFKDWNFVFNLFRKLTKNALLPQGSMPLTAGVTAPPTINIGEIQNNGLDLSIGYNKNIGELKIDIFGTISGFRNKVNVIDGNPNTIFLGPIFGQGGLRASRIVVGQPISVFYGLITDGVIQEGTDAGNFNFRDLNDDGKITSDDQTFIGSPHPDFSYSLNLNLGYKDFDLSALFRGVAGNKIWNFNKWATDFDTRANFSRNTRVITDAWTAENKSNKLAEYNSLTAAYNFQASTYYLENGSFLKLQNLQLGYTFKRLKGLNKLRIFVQGENLFTITDYLGFDPEVYLSNENSMELGVDVGNIYPVSKFYSAGINVEF